MNVKKAERQFILQFIEMYRSLPALWDVKCKDYTNRGKKKEQYDVLIKKYREYIPNADKQDVIKKINSLRTNFRKELKRIRETKKSDANPEDVLPSLWYFEEMKFLQNLEAPYSSDSSMNQFIDPGSSLYESTATEGSDKKNDKLLTSESNAQVEPPRKKKRPRDISEQLTQLSCEYFKNLPNYYNTIAAAWAVELQNMAETQQMLAKKFINEIIFEGQMGTLHRDSVVINNPPRTSSPLSVQSLPLYGKHDLDSYAQNKRFY